MSKKQTLAILNPDGKKVPVPETIVLKYGLAVGSKAPFSGLPVVALGRELTGKEGEAEKKAAEMQKLATTKKKEAEAARKKPRKRKTTKKKAATRKKKTSVA